MNKQNNFSTSINEMYFLFCLFSKYVVQSKSTLNAFTAMFDVYNADVYSSVKFKLKGEILYVFFFNFVCIKRYLSL